MRERIGWWLFVAIEAVLSLGLVACDVSAWLDDWTTGIVVTAIVAALLTSVWGGIRELSRER